MMEIDGKVSVVIPAFNESAMIAATISEARSYFLARAIPFEIIVVAEGTDGTERIAREAALGDDRIHVIAALKRRGKGAAVRQGVLEATGSVIGYMDADGKTPVDAMDRLLPCLRDAPVVIGSRATGDARILRTQRWYRRAGSRVFSVYLHAVLGLRQIPDTQCGLKFFRRDVARDLFRHLTIGGYMFDVELLYLCTRRGIAIRQVGVQWSDDADSRLNVFSGNIRNFLDVFKLAMRYRIRRPTVWPKTVPDLNPAQREAREQFVREWLEVLPRKYTSIERFNHGFVAGLQHTPGCKTLEIGPGLGEHLRHERADQDYHCLEYRDDFCRKLRDLLPADHVHCGDIQQTQSKWSDGMFDRIIAIHVLEHLPRLPDALEEVSRLLSHEGAFDVVVPCEGGLAYSLARKISAERMFRRKYRMDYGPIIRSEHVNTHREIVSLLRDFFQVDRVRFFPTFVPLAALNFVAAYRLTKKS